MFECETPWCLQAVVGQEIWWWAKRLETVTERNCWVYDGYAWEESGPRVGLLLP